MGIESNSLTFNVEDKAAIATEESNQSDVVQQTQEPQEEMVWISATGSKYHSRSDCGQMDPSTSRQLSVSEAEAQGYEPCKKCH